MNFQQLRSVREAVRRGFNLTEVALHLNTSQPGVSRQIRELEDELGIEIFVRAGKRLTGLTPPGEAVLPIVERLLLDAENLKRAGQDFMAHDSGPLSRAWKSWPALRKFSASSSNRSTIGSTALPGGVRPVRRLPARTKISMPSSSSSSRICRLTPGCEVLRCSATSVRLKPRRAASRTERNCWKFIGVGS